MSSNPPLFPSSSSLPSSADDIFSDVFFTPAGDAVFVDPSAAPLPGADALDDVIVGGGNGGGRLGFAAAPTKKRPRGADRKMSEQQKVERRERNREHAKRSRIRKKFLLESLQRSVDRLREENGRLREAIETHVGPGKGGEPEAADPGIIAPGPAGPGGRKPTVLDDPDFSFIRALQTAQQNFVVTDPGLPDNPIV
jgi:hypothetical protein